MRRFVKWVLLPAVLLVGMASLTTQRAEAARVWVSVGYPGYYTGYHYAYRPYVYRPRVVLPRPV